MKVAIMDYYHLGEEIANQIKEFNHPMFMGIDINSGFEIEPGIKDINQIKIFLNHLT